MARVNVYLPDELLYRAKTRKLNISALAREAVEVELRKASFQDWAEAVMRDPPLAGVSQEAVRKALEEARDEMWGDDDRPENYRRLG